MKTLPSGSSAHKLPTTISNPKASTDISLFRKLWPSGVPGSAGEECSCYPQLTSHFIAAVCWVPDRPWARPSERPGHEPWAPCLRRSPVSCLVFPGDRRNGAAARELRCHAQRWPTSVSFRHKARGLRAPFCAVTLTVPIVPSPYPRLPPSRPRRQGMSPSAHSELLQRKDDTQNLHPHCYQNNLESSPVYGASGLGTIKDVPSLDCLPRRSSPSGPWSTMYRTVEQSHDRMERHVTRHRGLTAPS